MQLLLLIYIYTHTHVVYPNTKQAFNKELLNRHPLKYFSPQSLANIPVVSVQLKQLSSPSLILLHCPSDVFLSRKSSQFVWLCLATVSDLVEL